MRTIIDMAGRTVSLPDKIERIYAPSPYASTLLYSLCPEKVCGNFFPIEEYQKPYLPSCLHNTASGAYIVFTHPVMITAGSSIGAINTLLFLVARN